MNTFGESAQKPPTPHVTNLNTAGEKYQRLLGGPPNSHGMKSGFVSLDAGDSVGSHSTKNAEELILFLEGKGQITLPHGQSMAVDAGQAAYIPPHTEHNVNNSGTIPLQYVYVVSPIRD